MHVKDIQATVPKVRGVAVGFGGFLRRRKRLTVAVVVAALLLVPLLLTGDGEVFVLNAVGLGFGALLLRRFARAQGQAADGTGATGPTEGRNATDDTRTTQQRRTR